MIMLRCRQIIFVCLPTLFLLVIPEPVRAGALTDGSVGAVQNLSGNFTIPQTLGTVVGPNLYHSFQNFSIGAGETGTFTTTNATLTNLISRVTGGQVSNIQGVLRLAPAVGSTPNFFFINPAGVTFGNGAVVDVPAAFHVSTAPRLNFLDGSQWDTSSASVSVLSASAPASFGFLPAVISGKVTINNRNIATDTIVSQFGHDMRMKNGAYTDIVAGDVEIEDTNLYTSGAGKFRIVAVGTNLVTVPINGEATGAVGGVFSMLRSVLAAENAPSTIDVRAGAVTLGHEGEIYIINRTSAAAAGAIDIRATSGINLVEGAEIGSVTFASGSSADINIQASTLTIAGNDDNGATGIISDTRSTGMGGNVSIDISGSASIYRGGLVSASSRGSGSAGSITLSANELLIDRAGSPVTMVNVSGTSRDKYTTGIYSDTSGAGAAGNLSIVTTDALTIMDGGVISSRTSNAGRAGSVAVSGSNLSIDGVSATALFTGITTQAETGSSGKAGNVDVWMNGKLTLREAGAITSDTYGTGAAGSVLVNAGQLTADGAGTRFFTGISSEATSTSGGQTGNVTVTATNGIALANSAQLSIRSSALASVPNALMLSSLTAAAPVIMLLNGAAMTAEAKQNTHASRIVMNAADSFFLSRSSITTSARDGNGGPISVSAGRIGWLFDSSATTSVTGINGNGGDIDIRAPFLILQSGFIQANTTALLASGGLVNINVDNLLPSANNLLIGGSSIRTFQVGRFGYNVIQAAAPTGVNGVITLSTPQLDLSATLAPLNTAIVDLSSLIASACQAPADNSLVVMLHSAPSSDNSGQLRPERSLY